MRKVYNIRRQYRDRYALFKALSGDGERVAPNRQANAAKSRREVGLEMDRAST